MSVWLIIEVAKTATIESVIFFVPFATMKPAKPISAEDRTDNPIINEFIELIKNKRSDSTWGIYDEIPKHYIYKHFKLGENRHAIEEKLVGVGYYGDYDNSRKAKCVEMIGR
jgi:hypothetical protein